MKKKWDKVSYDNEQKKGEKSSYLFLWTGEILEEHC